MNGQVTLHTDATGRSRLQQALTAFKAALNETQRAELDQLSVQPQLRAVLQFTADLDEKNAERRSRCIAARLQTVLESVQQFSGVVETCVSSNPRIAALIWGSLKFALLIASNFASYFEKLTRLFMSFGKLCPRYAEYHSLFPKAEKLQDSLCDFYATLIRCCIKAVEVVQRPGWTQLLKATLSPFENDFGCFESALRQCSQEVKEQIRLAAIKAQVNEQKLAGQDRKMMKDYIGNVRKREKQLNKHTQITQRQTLLDKLSDFDYTSPLKKARFRCVKGTAHWFTQMSQFQEWIGAVKPSVLTLSGKLGSGKTIVMANIVMHLSQELLPLERIAYFFCQYGNTASRDATTIFSSIIKQLLDPENMTRATEDSLKTMTRSTHLEAEELEAVLLQATAGTDSRYIIIDAIDECEEAEKKLLCRVLKSAYTYSKGKVKICLSTRDKNVPYLQDLSSTHYWIDTKCTDAQGDLGTFIKSTLEMHIADEDLVLGTSVTVEEIYNALLHKADGMFLWIDFQMKDICSQASDYGIRTVLKQLPRGLSETYDRLLTRIRDNEKELEAGKIFRRIACARRHMTIEEVREAISIEPLQPYFMPERCVNEVDRLVSFCHGLVVRDEEDDILRFTHPSVVRYLFEKTMSPTNCVFHIDPYEANYELGQICLTYLHFNDFKTQLSRLPKARMLAPQDIVHATYNNTLSQPVRNALAKSLPEKLKGPRRGLDMNTGSLQFNPGSKGPVEAFKHNYAFLDYASHFGILHTAGFNKDDLIMWDLWEQLLFSEDAMVFKPWTPEEFQQRDWAVAEFIGYESHLALLQSIEESNIRFGKAQMSWLLSSRASGDEQFFEKMLASCQISKHQITLALIEATRLGHAERAERLIAEGASFYDFPNVDGHPALQYAAHRGDQKLVRNLLATGASAKAPITCQDFPPALQCAAEQGNVEIVQMLIDGGADVDAEWRGEPRTALQAAVIRSHISIIEILAAVAAHVSIESALRTAVEQDLLVVADLLLAARTNGHFVSLYNGGGIVGGEPYDTRPKKRAPHWAKIEEATHRGHTERRLDHEVAGPIPSSWKESLVVAAKGNDIKALAILQKKMASVQLIGAVIWTCEAVDAAAREGHAQAVELLLRLARARSLLMCNPKGYSARRAQQALHVASHFGHIEVARELLAVGAGLNKPRGFKYSVLVDAARQGNVEIIEMALAAEVDKEDMIVAKAIATLRGYDEIVEKLERRIEMQS